MRWYECVNVAGWEGLWAACTPHEVERMSFTIIETLGKLGLSLTSFLFTHLSTQSTQKHWKTDRFNIKDCSMRFANHGRELKCKPNIFQPTLAVSVQHNERLRLKFITLRTAIVLQKHMNPFEQPPEDEDRKRYHVMIRVAMNNRFTVFAIVTAAISLHSSFSWYLSNRFAGYRR